MSAQLDLAGLAPEPLARPTTRVLSYGGGLDSFAVLVRAIQRGELPDAVAFVDVRDPDGHDPGEWPGTYRHLREVVAPLCVRHGIPFEWIDSRRYPVRDARSLFAWLEARKQIPVAGPNRVCTRVAKVERFERWLSDRYPGRRVEVWLGFEAGEEARAAKDPNSGSRRLPRAGQAVRVNRFPLIEAGICRCRAAALVRAAGLPVPRKSACVFCPYGTRGDWQAFAAASPVGFARVVDLEERKPPTAKRGVKLSIMDFRTVVDPATGARTHRPTPLPEFVAKAYTRKAKPCAVCGAAARATKACGDDWL